MFRECFIKKYEKSFDSFECKLDPLEIYNFRIERDKKSLKILSEEPCM